MVFSTLLETIISHLIDVKERERERKCTQKRIEIGRHSRSLMSMALSRVNRNWFIESA